ncbi:MAG TPA: LD-carboxypeptidase [Spirochaetales bacterium]|nr:LD-carboxypeptidase [Spirochaetales bacterium]
MRDGISRPRRLKAGDRVAAVSISWGGPELFPGVFDEGVRRFRECLGLELVEFPTARRPTAALRADPRARADDLNRAWRDPSIRAVICSIGGSDAIRMLEHLDLDAARADPKPFIGYSDATNLLCLLAANGLPAFHGPALMSGFAQLGAFPEAAEEYRRAFFGDWPDPVPFPRWTDEYRGWGEGPDFGAVGEIRANGEGHVWLKRGARRSGRLWGGCVESLDGLNGTPYWPRGEFWDDVVLFLETSEDAPPPSLVKAWLRNFAIQGILGRAAGLLVARPKAYSSDGEAELREAILDVVEREYPAPDLNVVVNLDFGHTDPRHILPLGIELELDPEAGALRYLESPWMD